VTLASQTGAENVCDTIVQILRDKMPGKIATFNASEGPYIRAHFGGDYVFASDKTLIISRNNGSATTYTISAATYTVAQMITALNGLSGFSTHYEAVSIMGGNYFEIRDKTKGANSNLILGEGTANSTFGFIDNSVHNFYALQNTAVYRTQTRALDPTLVAYPAMTIFADVESNIDNNLQMIQYNVFLRLYNTTVQPELTPQKESMYTQLFRYWDLMREVLFDRDYNALWSTQINNRRMIRVAPGEQIMPLDSTRMHWLLWLDIQLEISVQEDWQ
jgi:hypothetical protein